MPSVPRATPSAQPTPPQTPAGHVRHIIVVVQENRSFDNLFHAFPGADTASVAQTTTGPVTLQPWTLAGGYDLGHEHGDAIRAVDNGKMDGFNYEAILRRPGKVAPPHAQFVYTPIEQVAPYWTMAKWGVLGDRFFGVLDASFVAHQYLIAGQAAHTIDVPNGYPWGCDSHPSNRVPIVNDQGGAAGSVFPCFTYRTLGDELLAKNVSWRYYAPTYGSRSYIWSGYDAVRNIRNTAAWVHVRAPETRFLTDVADGELAAVTWIIPQGPDSDHPGNSSALGPAWVSSIVNAVGASPFWEHSVILVLWDDWGGLYDHVAPPPGDQFGPGIRVPLIVLSPFALRGAVAHSTYTFGSVMRLIEDSFGLQRLTRVDDDAASLGLDVFDFNQAPRKFGGPFGLAGDRSMILSQPRSLEPPDGE